MPPVVPEFAVVRPRVVVVGTDESCLLDEVVAELADELESGLIRITGECGSGKSSALAHLATLFAGDNRLIFLDEPSQEELEKCGGESLVIATMPSGKGPATELALEPWSQDELIEYLLAKHPQACGSVIVRLGDAARRLWTPQVAVVVLDRFAEDASLATPGDAVMQHVFELTTAPQQLEIAKFCLRLITGRLDLDALSKKRRRFKFPETVQKLLRHRAVQLPLAADRVMSAVLRQKPKDLERRLPDAVIEFVGEKSSASARARESLKKLLASERTERAHAMAASILHAADSTWRPEERRKPWNFVGAVFKNASWSGVELKRADLIGCDLTGADLTDAVLNSSYTKGTRFTGARLCRASLLGINGIEADFSIADLEGARLANARLVGANFKDANLTSAALMFANLTGANFSSASLREADLTQADLAGATLADADMSDAVLCRVNLSGLDLREICLDGANCENARFISAQMEDIRVERANFRDAVLRGAHLTGSSLPQADLRGADLSRAGLAEIDWEGADLRGAKLVDSTFHMGSSRSGLVGSPIACEGSKTGFYTDDFEDLNYKRPEEVRKANLRGADLRDVVARNVDFYLVDLRDAKLDSHLREQAAKTGAILEDVVT